VLHWLARLPHTAEEIEIMKEGIHPNYREVCFVDLSNGFKFVTRSCVNTKEMGKTEDGRELPLYKLDTSSESHPSTRARKSRWTTWVAASRSSARTLEERGHHRVWLHAGARIRPCRLAVTHPARATS
jgi:ribosomal protein L31